LVSRALNFFSKARWNRARVAASSRGSSASSSTDGLPCLFRLPRFVAIGDRNVYRGWAKILRVTCAHDLELELPRQGRRDVTKFEIFGFVGSALNAGQARDSHDFSPVRTHMYSPSYRCSAVPIYCCTNSIVNSLSGCYLGMGFADMSRIDRLHPSVSVPHATPQ
jgi:hypothetical protein